MSDTTVPQVTCTCGQCDRYAEMIDALTDELAASEECPYYTDEGCPRPDDAPSAHEKGDRCDKHDRRGRHGKECWRLWAEKRCAK